MGMGTIMITNDEQAVDFAVSTRFLHMDHTPVTRAEMRGAMETLLYELDLYGINLETVSLIAPLYVAERTSRQDGKRYVSIEVRILPHQTLLAETTLGEILSLTRLH